MRLLGAFFLWLSLSAAQIVPGRYVVELSGPPLGGAARGAKSQRRAALEAQQAAVRRAIEQRSGRVVDSLRAVMNGLVVESPAGEAALEGLPGVARVYPVELVHADLDRVLPLHQVREAWAAAGGMERAGAGIKIGILDSGITPDHAGFQDPSLNAPAGYPLASSAENLALTSGKIIVARSYGQIYELRDSETVRDQAGHGTAVAMCAAGAPNDGPYARITGVAPKAWLGVYKVFPGASGTARTDVIAKALDDALADGMDVVNLSLGSAMVLRLDQSILALAVERMTRFGVMVVVSAGNSGPAPASIGNNGSIPSAIAVGASDSSRTFGGAVTPRGGEPLLALPGNGPAPEGPLSAPARDVATDPCGELDAEALGGRIVLAKAGSCLFEQQLNNAEEAGAVAIVLYPPSSRTAPVRMGVREAKLPAVMVSWESAEAIRAALGREPDAPVRVAFEGVAFPNDSSRLQSFSSRGPTYQGYIKPDLAATGYVYTAAQSANPGGSVYGKSGYTAASGTSFSAPIVAGAAAVLKGMRPGLTVDQYRSLLVNSASPLILANGWVERVQRTGSGTLNLWSAVTGTVAAYPTSLSFGIGPGSLASYDQLTITNVGRAGDTFTISTARYDDAPALLFSENPGMGAAETMSVAIGPGQSKTVYPSWRAERLAAGEYQGQIQIRDTRTGSTALVPYWHAVPSNVVTTRTLVSAAPPTQAPVGQAVTLYYRLTDDVGLAVLERQYMKFSGTAVLGGGTIGDAALSSLYPNLVLVTMRLGPEPGRNIFRIAFGDLAPVEYTIEGIRPQ